MLRHLHIQNLAVIADATIELAPGLNCFTGQTGAGKSLVLGAFEILLGLRTAGDMLRPGAEEGRVSGVFEVRDPAVAATLSQTLDQAIEPEAELLITRKLFASGRTSVSVNGQPATAAMVRQAGEQLVDIHGQHDHQYLLKPANQLDILDQFARCGDVRDRFAEAYQQLRQLQRRRDELSTSDKLRTQQIDLYTFQLDEIDAAEPIAGEFHELKARLNMLGNVSKIKQEAGTVHAALYDSDGSIIERLQMLTQVMMDLAELDEELTDVTEQVRTSTLTLQEAAYEVGRYADRLEFDPDEHAEVEQRLNQLNRLIAKYVDGPLGDDPVADLLTYREQIAAELVELRGDGEDLDTLTQRIADAQHELATVGGELTKKRAKAAKKLKPLIEAQLKELGMAEAKFAVQLDTAQAASADSPTGLDAVEFVVQTNPGQPQRPLRKIASGGELSRVMLALKSILAGSDRVSVLVFDEIDANIGGRLGSVIGLKLRELAKSEQGHQVLCITHLPQIAAYADQHLRIAKHVTGKGKSKQTQTTVTAITGQDRVSELAEMMAGAKVTQTTTKQAAELLELAGA